MAWKLNGKIKVNEIRSPLIAKRSSVRVILHAHLISALDSRVR